MRTTRTRLAGLSLLAGGIVMMVPPLLGAPADDANRTAELQRLARDSTTPVVKSLLFQLAVLLILPGILAIFSRTTGGRGAKAVLSGVVIYVTGLIGVFTFVAVEGAKADLATSGPITPSLVNATDALGSAGSLLPAMILGLLLWHLLGLPILTWGMVRNGQLSWRAAALATIGTLAAFFGSGTAIETLGWEVLGVSFVLIATTILRPGVAKNSEDTDVERQAVAARV